MTKELVLVLVFVILATAGFLIWYKRRPESLSISRVTITGRTFKVELALSPAEQAKGLSGRESLETGTGMLFIFTQAKVATFHMRNMNFPIDIVWINADRKVVSVERNAQPWTGMIGEFYRSPEAVKYVLEVSAGEADEIKVGDNVKLSA